MVSPKNALECFVGAWGFLNATLVYALPLFIDYSIIRNFPLSALSSSP